jgi:hypothetical protein
LLAIFCLFSAIGFVSLMTRGDRLPRAEIVCTVLVTGGFSTFFAFCAIHKKYLWMVSALVVMTASIKLLAHSFANDPVLLPNTSPLFGQLHLLGAGAIIALSGGYSFFLVFSSREGERFFLTHAEIKLARELHQALVPAVELKVGGFEVYGASLPSGEVGGDLVDVVPHGVDWTAYVADVSGHGVAPGVLMAMFKASVRSRMVAGCDGASLLQGVHQTLYPLKTSNMFITAGFLQSNDGLLSLSLAGHPSLLHLRKRSGEVCEYPSADLPIGILPEQSFSARVIDCQPDDILLLLTDGIMEAADRDGDELGIEPVKAVLRENPDMPLPDMFRKIRALATSFGKQTDDQTMLLVRRVEA